MKWSNNIITGLSWSTTITNREAKEKVAKEVASQAVNYQVIGAGSGSTVYLALFALAERIQKEGLQIQVIPASIEISMTCIQLGIPQTTLWTHKPDWTFDGADEVDPSLHLIKGRGGAMFKEKLLICNSAKTFILIDESKLVERLGVHFPIPIEVSPPALTYVEEQIKKLNASEVTLRLAKGKDGPVVTENGNFILDARFDKIPLSLEKDIKSITGVVESGLFIGYNPQIIIARDE